MTQLEEYHPELGTPMEINTKLKALPKGWDYQRILTKVKTERASSEDNTLNKRQRKREQLQLYVNKNKEKGNISSNLLYQLMQSWTAVNLADKSRVGFLGREWNDEDIAENINSTAKYDWEEMHMPEMEVLRRFHEGMFGVSILAEKEWDGNRKVPVFEVIDPLTWMPDLSGWMRSGNFRFMGFEKKAHVHELNAKDGFINIDIIKEGVKSVVTIQNEVAYARPRNIVAGIQEELDGNNYTDIYHHYTRIDGVPYVISLTNNMSLIIRCEALRAVTKAEKADPTLIEFPVILRYYSPLPFDPWGISLADIAEDTQIAMTTLKNLQLIKERNSALGDLFLVNQKKIKNRTELLKAPGLKPRYIGIDGPAEQGDIMAVEKSQPGGEYYNFEQQLRQDVSLDTGISNIQSGVQNEDKRTASEIRQAQANANSRFLLGFTISTIADKEFWKLWYRCYKKYLKDEDEKFVRLTSGLTPKTTILNRKDICGIEDPDVIIDSEENIKNMNDQVVNAWMATYNFYMADPDMKTIAKTVFKRKFYQIVLKWTKEEAYEKVLPSIDEIKAQEDVKMINKGKVIKPQSMKEDHYTYLVLYQTAEDSIEKDASIEMRKLAILLQGEMQQAQATNGATQGTQAQIMGNMMSKQNDGTQPQPAPTVA